MLKIFIVEDESVIREGLRDNIPWQDYGYELVGEASDGEMALPMIRKSCPDLLLTDIKMPFMDGLTLCHILGQEFPRMKLVVMSGYDDFEYARRAIHEGVVQYMLKPITRRSLRQMLDEIRERIEREQQKQSYQERFQRENREYERFQRREYFEKLFSAQLSVEKMYEEAGRLSLDVSGPCYNLILFSLSEQKNTGERGRERFLLAEGELIRFFLRFPEYILSKWNLNSYCVIVKGEAEIVSLYTEKGMERIREICEAGQELQWYAAAGKMTERFSALSDCFHALNRVFATRFFRTEQHILTEEQLECFRPASEQEALSGMKPQDFDTAAVQEFLENGEAEEAADFVRSYLRSLEKLLQSRMLRDYIVLGIRFAVLRYIERLGVSQTDFTGALRCGLQDFEKGEEALRDYVEELLTHAVEVRERLRQKENTRFLKQALAYMELHFTEEGLSLHSVAEHCGVSGSYLSTAFSREMGETFVEYVTRRRMELAKRLLREERLHTAECAARVGYRDPHYFSFVFRRTQGMSARDYRSSTVS